MTIDSDPRNSVLSSYSGNERTRVAPNRRPNYTLRRIVAASGLVLAAAAIDVGASEEQTYCVTTKGASSAWENGTVAVKNLREMGAKIDDKRDAIDPLADMPNFRGQGEGIGVCATQRTGVIGSFIGAEVQVG